MAGERTRQRSVVRSPYHIGTLKAQPAEKTAPFGLEPNLANCVICPTFRLASSFCPALTALKRRAVDMTRHDPSQLASARSRMHAPFPFGIEEEYFLVDAQTKLIAHD